MGIDVQKTLGIGRLEAGHEDFRVQTTLDFLRTRAFEEEFDGLPEVCDCALNGFTSTVSP